MTLLVLLTAWRAGVPIRPGPWLIAAMACDMVGLTLWGMA
jgi:hypothetical protein